MGDPKKLRKKYKTPIHPWKLEDIEKERELVKEYKLSNKKELWKIASLLKKYKNLAKKLISTKTEQSEKEKKQILEKLQRWGLLLAGAELDKVLDLEIKDVLERRLQSLVYRLGLSRSMKQARQFIVHRHIMIGDKKITTPNYIVSQVEESQIKFDEKSTLNDEDHPERAKPEEITPIENKKVKVEEESPAISEKELKEAEKNI